MCAWRRQLNHKLDKVSKIQKPRHLFNTPKTVPNLNLRPIIHMELFHGNMDQIALKSNK